jgi:hypothetical protein
LVSKQIGAIFAILGGVFYIIGSFVGGALLFGFSGLYMSYGAAEEAGVAFAVFGVFAGVLIIVGGALLNADSSGRRKAGGILAVVMMVLGAIPTLGGLGIGFLLALIGSVIGLTYKGQPDFVIGMAPMSPFQPSMPPQAVSIPVAKGRIRYCMMCGSPLDAGAVFCGSCGAKIPQS